MLNQNINTKGEKIAIAIALVKIIKDIVYLFNYVYFLKPTNPVSSCLLLELNKGHDNSKAYISILFSNN